MVQLHIEFVELELYPMRLSRTYTASYFKPKNIIKKEKLTNLSMSQNSLKLCELVKKIFKIIKCYLNFFLMLLEVMIDLLNEYTTLH